MLDLPQTSSGSRSEMYPVSVNGLAGSDNRVVFLLKTTVNPAPPPATLSSRNRSVCTKVTINALQYDTGGVFHERNK